jgi:hypothetical protein
MATDIDAVDWRSVCPISSALDVLGDKWSLLIIRDLLIHGPRTYSEFLASPEHISTNILASRLKLLTCLKLIERTDPEGTAAQQRLPTHRKRYRPAARPGGTGSMGADPPQGSPSQHGQYFMTTPTDNSDKPRSKKALVIGVGAEKGLGASISARFAREGFHVIVAGRTRTESLEQVVQQIRSSGGTATASPGRRYPGSRRAGALRSGLRYGRQPGCGRLQRR